MGGGGKTWLILSPLESEGLGVEAIVEFISCREGFQALCFDWLIWCWKRFLSLGQFWLHHKGTGMACKEAPDRLRLCAAWVIPWTLWSAATWSFMSLDHIFLDLDLGGGRGILEVPDGGKMALLCGCLGPGGVS